MTKIFQPLMFMLAAAAEDQLRRQIELLKAENEMLRKRIPKQRILLDQAEKDRLVDLGLALGPAIRHLITIVSYSTFRRWVRIRQGPEAKTRKMGRPRIAESLQELVLKMAKGSGWGYTRILGELRKLKIAPICRQSVKNILSENGFDTGPKRGKATWSEFLEIHKDTLWQIDFFSKRVWTFKGPRQMFALAFLHLATRRVFVTPGSFKPNSDWMETQAKAFLDHAEEQNLDCSIIIRDMDCKFSKPFEKVFKDREKRILKVGPKAPNLNAFIERWIRSIKFEALNHFILCGKAHFDLIVSTYVEFYNECRPHQGIGNRTLPKADGPPDEPAEVLPFNPDEIEVESRLGGLLRHYYRKAG